ncbi:MAG: alkylation response protein AidB-like acyl-CoA dehydrogenase [Cellvibrionaceae bacterium]|jgi:alkylation response protein AidB-like acyl-CoA dehydrogenase
MSNLTNDDALEMAESLAKKIGARAAQADREGRFPAEDAIDLKQSGFTKLNLPKELGGFGMSMRTCIESHLILSSGSTSTGLVASMTMNVIGHENEARSWPDPIYEKVASVAATEGILINNVASEPKLGSPSRGGAFQTFASKSADGKNYIVNGHKNWITGGKHLTHMIVRLGSDDGAINLLVEADRPGLRWDHTWGDALSLRASDSNDLYFEDAVVPVENLAVRPVPISVPNIWFGLLMASTYLGGAVGARNAIIKYALERVPTGLGKPIATLPGIQRQIGELDTALQAAKALLLDVASMWDSTAGINMPVRQAMIPRIAAAKTVATNTAAFVTDKALQVAGGASISRDLPLERFFRDVRAGTMHPPSGDAAMESVGRGALGL